MATTAEIIGEMLKEKYPVYKNKDTIDLGQRYLNKYPEKANNVLSRMGNTVSEGISNLLEKASSILSQKGPITQAFGNYNPQIEKYSGGINTGVDIGVPTGTRVATPQGRWKVVEVSGNGNFNRGYGNSVFLQNEDTGEKLRFSHLSQILGLQPGQELPENTVFGQTGATGNVTGPHLDLEYYDKLGKLGDVLQTAYGRGLNG